MGASIPTATNPTIRLLLLPRVHTDPSPPPAEPVAPGLWIRTVSPGQAVAELIRSSALVLLDTRAAAGHLDSLRRLATSCEAFRLYHGPAALETPEALPDLVAALLSQRAWGASDPRPGLLVPG